MRLVVHFDTVGCVMCDIHTDKLIDLPFTLEHNIQ